MNTRRDELETLLVRRAVEGLDAEETRRLNALLAEHPEVDAEWVDRLVGELDAETLAETETALPAELRAGLLDAAAAHGATDGSAGSYRGADRRAGASRNRALQALRWSGWALAAAVAGLWIIGPLDTPLVPDVPAFQQVAAESDAVTGSWEPGPDPTGSAVSGEIVWSGQAQQGVMRLRGLAVNPPEEFQYQLWIFDEERDERYPVDGGVFDMPPDEVEAEVPVQAKLAVGVPTLFAVTVEPPGGVVVSDRERIATLARVSD